MTPGQLERIEEIFYAALDQEPDQVARFLDTACHGDEVLRRKVEALLASRQRAASFIETSAAGLATKIIGNGQADLLVDRTIGHYKISKRIGSGGMGEVYLATDVTAGRKAALKLLPVRFTVDPERLKRFQQEAHAVVGLNHPNILTVYEIGEDHSIHYIASELIEGETLRQRLMRGRMQLSEAVDVAIQVASALAAAHQAGIVHRDIKPENIMLRPDGYVKVLDFGIAKLAESAFAEATADGAGSMTLAETNLGSILGTVRYMSPEQACGAPVDKRTDIWSLGAALYEMVTGHRPFIGDTPAEVMSSILEEEPAPLHCQMEGRALRRQRTREGSRELAPPPRELQEIISKTLRKDREGRYKSAHELLEALKDLRRKLEFEAALRRSTAAPLWLRWIRSPIALVLVLVVAALALVLPFFWHRNQTTSLPPEKSVAVLPFENLSKDEENAFFAGGVHDEILTNLAKVADLKVISRMSVMKYKSGLERNLREIAKALGVSHVVEGTVQRAGERVRVSAQLIDARNDAHLWAEQYDRDVADVFAIQSEIARQIADQLQTKLSPAEKAAIAERPTADPVAYALYTEAKAISDQYDWEGAEKSLNRAVGLFEKAMQHDPNFALAYCALAKTQGDLFSATGAGSSSLSRTHLESAKKAAEAALRVRPDLGEAHLELARYYFWAGDFDRARDELTVARRKMPNNSEALYIAARIDRRQNRWDDSLANFRKASELDPRNTEVAAFLGYTYFLMRRYNELEQFLTKEAASGTLKDPWIQSVLAMMKLAQGDPLAAQSLLAQVPMDFSPDHVIWETRFTAALYLRDYDAASRIIADTPAKFAYVHDGQPPESLADGEVARARGDKEKALAVFAAARKKMEATWGDKPKDDDYFAGVARLDAGLGRKEEAIRQALRAVDLRPIGKDSLNGPTLIANLALVYAWTGERDRAFEQLEIVAKIPAGPTYGDLCFDPCWDDLRGDPRFDKIVAAAKAASNIAPSASALTSLPEKSIAVLPLENLSEEKENAFFADGVHDELLSNLAKIKDLKVISRTSVMQYKSGIARNLKEIAQQLGVSNVVEGSVRRAGNKVRVSVQLIDARTDTHLWAEQYDRDVADVFAVQTDIARQIADQLRAKLSVAETVAIAERPTADLVAYALYTKAKEIDIWGDWEGAEKSMARKVELLEKATQRDPNFSLAYCALAKTHGDLSYDRTHLELAKKAADAALRVRPNLGEAHRELARYYYYARDFDRARDELTVAQRTLPNDSEALLIGTRIDKRQNRWDASLAGLQKTSELDPRNNEVAYHLGRTYLEMRRYHEMEQLMAKQAASGVQENPWIQNLLAETKLAQGDSVAAQTILEQVPLDFSPIEWIWRIRFTAALYLRDYDAANRVIAATPAKFAYVHGGQPPESWADGLIARARGDKQKALAVFAAARKNVDATWGDKPKDQFYFEQLARVDAGLGRKEGAIREALRAVELMPIAKDSYWGPLNVANLALVYAWTGERDRALEQLKMVATIPAGPTYGDLRFNPCWDSLRGDKRFDKIVAAAKAASR